MSQAPREHTTVAVAGLGAIGLAVARPLDQGIEGLRLTAVSARDVAKAEAKLAGFRDPPPVVPLADLAARAEVVVECVPAAEVPALAESVLSAGRTLVPLSVGALLPRMDLVDLARRHGGRIIVPSGAIGGLDAVRAAAEGAVESVTLTTRKPPGGLAGAPHLVEQGISLEGLTEPLMVFEGTAREGAKGFPANVNVAAALSLAGIGPDRTRLQIWADPTIARNSQSYTLEADAVRVTMTIENVPSEENPRTGKVTALSVIATLKRLVAPLVVGP